MTGIRPHPQLAEAAHAHALPLMAAQAAIQGLPLKHYQLAVRRHLHRALRGCKVYIRMLPERFEFLLEHGYVPVLGEYPRDTSESFETHLAALVRRHNNEARLFTPPPRLTYGSLAERLNPVHQVGVYGSIILEIARTDDMYWLHGDSGAMFKSTQVRVPSLLQFPHELSWSWDGDENVLLEAALPMGRVHEHSDYLEVLIPRRVTWADVQAVHFEAAVQALDYFWPVRNRGVRVEVSGDWAFCRPAECATWADGASTQISAWRKG